MTRATRILALVSLLLVLAFPNVVNAAHFWIPRYRLKGESQWEKGPPYLYYPDQKDDSSRSKSLAWQFLREHFDETKYEFDVVHEMDGLFADPVQEKGVFDGVIQDQEKGKKKYPEENAFELARLHYQQRLLTQRAEALNQQKVLLERERDKLVKEGLALIRQEAKTSEEKREWDQKREDLKKRSIEYRKQMEEYEKKREQLEQQCQEYKLDCAVLLTKASKDNTIQFVQVKTVDFKVGLTGNDSGASRQSEKLNLELDGTHWRDSDWLESPDTYMTFVKNKDGKNNVTYHYIVPQGTETGKRASNLRGYWSQSGEKVFIESHIEKGDSRYWQLKGTIKGDRIVPDSDSEVQWTWVRVRQVNK